MHVVLIIIVYLNGGVREEKQEIWVFQVELEFNTAVIMVNEVADLFQLVFVGEVFLVDKKLCNLIFVFDQFLANCDGHFLLIPSDGKVEDLVILACHRNIKPLHQFKVLLIVKTNGSTVSKAVRAHLMQVDPRGVL